MYSYRKPIRRKKSRKSKSLYVTAMVLAVLGIFAAKLLVIFPTVYATADIQDVKLANTLAIPWPAYGQSAVGVKGHGVVSASPNQSARPTASVAKLVTALAILEKKPLVNNEQGEQIVISDADIAIYDFYLSHQGVVVDIKPGQSISQYKALQYMLILSANNIADISAKWAFGSVDEYTAYANDMVKKMGLSTMHIDDASGLSPKTISSAEDLVRLGEYALDNPVIADIVAQESIDLPEGTQKINTNVFLNYQGNGVIGIKNGLTDEAGGVLLAAAKRTVDNTQLTIISVVMGSERYFDSQKDAVALIDPTVSALSGSASIAAGTVVGHYDVPWGENADVITKEPITLNKWTNALDASYVELYPITTTTQKGTVVGKLTVPQDGANASEAQIMLDSDVNNPSTKWRILGLINKTSY